LRTIDLRSDTITQPCDAMRDAMMGAKLGDDVLGEDPTVIKLQEKVAELLGKESALFVPSGTMANQVAMGMHVKPGDQIMGHRDNHIYRWEAGALARLWGASYREVDSLDPTNSMGILDAQDFAGHMQPDDPHYPVSRLICLENTLNRGGGRIFPLHKIKEIREFASPKNMKMHLDGARLFNAVVATGIPASTWAESFDTVSICLSKGLGCPVGSVVVGSTNSITHEGLRIRKVLGGGMRQVGILAAAGIYALDHNIERMKVDHIHAQIFSKAIEESKLFEIEFPVESNMVWFRVKDGIQCDAQYFSKFFSNKGLALMALTDRLLRAVFHLDISKEETQQAADLVSAVSDCT